MSTELETEREKRANDVRKAAGLLRATGDDLDQDFMLAGLHVRPYDDGWCAFYDPDYDENSLLDVVNTNDYQSARQLVEHLVAIQNAEPETDSADLRPEVH